MTQDTIELSSGKIKQSTDTGESLFQQLQIKFPAQRVELIFTIITFITMMAGLAADWLEAPRVFATVFYTIAYITGGTFGVMAGLDSLRHFTIDVDLLMVLAALGAAWWARRLKARCCSSFSRCLTCCKLMPWIAPVTPSAP